uniref:Uncharacterized protein n=1 Tax=Nicotiana tabacum TaxID=4097 RepID=A0A1S3YK15_TOBAC|nr:PREDICTED: uncharacterized protein LOC107777107 [Nicotiana tabacum]
MVNTEVPVDASSSNNSTYVPDSTSPLLLHSFDMPGMRLVSTPFSGSGYRGWRRSMIVSLSAKNKIGFVNGSCPRPITIDVAKLRQWDRCNNMVISWLTSSLSPTTAESVQYSETAESIWKQLERRYGAMNGTKKLWDELGTMRKNHGNRCMCAARDGIQKDEEEDKLPQFLMGLNELVLEAASFNVNANNKVFPLNVNSKTFPPKQYTQKMDFDQPKGNIFCKYYKNPGHLIDKCYKLHGFPQNFKFNKGKRMAANVTAEVECPATAYTLPQYNSPQLYNAFDHEEQASSVPGLTKQQYAQLMSLLQQTQVPSAVDSQISLMGSANFAGSTFSLPVYINDDSHICLLSGASRNVWIIDSEATDHMTSNKNMYYNLTPLPTPYLVTLPNGYKANVIYTGSVTLFPSFTLHRVLYIPSFQYNLVSVYKLILQISLHGFVYFLFMPFDTGSFHEEASGTCSPLLSSSLLVSTITDVGLPTPPDSYTISTPIPPSPNSTDVVLPISLDSSTVSAPTTAPSAKWSLFQLDVNNAFLHGDLDEEVYMKLPPSLTVASTSNSYSPLVCKLQKSASLPTMKSASSTVLLVVYVDDTILTGGDIVEIAALKQFLDDQFKIKDLGLLNYFLGIEILYDEFGGEVLPNPQSYRSLIGKLNFLTHTRPDLCFAVQHLSQFLKSPRIPHMVAAMHILRYLNVTLDVGVFLNASSDFSLQAFCDSDWAACPESRTSKSKKQAIVSLSSAEAEYRAMSKVVGELVCLVLLLADLDLPISAPVPVFCDNLAALHIAKNPVFHERTKHIEVDAISSGLSWWPSSLLTWQVGRGITLQLAGRVGIT